MRINLATKEKVADEEKSQPKKDLLSFRLQSHADGNLEDLPLPLRICLRADLKPKLYLPDLTTRARRAAIDSVDFAALDFFVGAIVIVGFVGVVVSVLDRVPLLMVTKLRFRHLPLQLLPPIVT
jgi:hypothetical protein